MKQFDIVKVTKPKSNVFDLSHERKMSCNMGELIPILLEEVVPGDSFRVNSEILLRMAPMVAPVMHRCNVYTHFFFVPNRLIWDEWEDFITGGREGTLTPNLPKIQINPVTKDRFVKGNLSDYFGIPPTDGKSCIAGFNVSQLPFRAYQLIYNEYYRDQNLTAPIDIPTGSTDLDTGSSTLNNLAAMRRRAWEKDYFTSCLPWAQRGEPVQIPITMNPNYSELSLLKDDSGYPTGNGGALSDAGASGNAHMTSYNDGNNTPLRVENLTDPQTDFNLTVADFRRVLKIQEWLEKSARTGSRYIEQILAHFGVKSSDARLQRPEYLGGGKNPVIISEVLNTTGTATAAQGEMAGHGISVGTSNRFTRSFEEHGFIIGIMSVLPKTAYQDGIERIWTKEDKFEYFWPEFAHIGEQEVKNKEIYLDYNTVDPAIHDGDFGYQMRYAEYKYRNSSVHGDFRDNLDHWHLGRKFTSGPALNTSFVEASPSHRIFAVETESIDKLYVQIYNDVRAMRPMPYFSTPRI